MDLFHIFYYNEIKRMEKKKRLLLLIFIILLVGVIVFVFINNHVEAPTGEGSSVQFKGPVGEPYVKGPTISPPGF